jgi:heat shock protein HslJ
MRDVSAAFPINQSISFTAGMMQNKQCHWRIFWRTRTVLQSTLLVVLVTIAAVRSMPASAQSFPFGEELRLDADPMPGSKKVPILDIGERGNAEIDLWCNSVKAQLVVAANTITIITGAVSSRQCGPNLMRADDDLMAALNSVTNWRMEGPDLVLVGPMTLRFVHQTN